MLVEVYHFQLEIVRASQSEVTETLLDRGLSLFFTFFLGGQTGFQGTSLTQSWLAAN